jgi:Ca-activated chloride channel family protein
MKYFFISTFFSATIFAQQKPVNVPITRVLFVFDASKSMKSKHDQTSRIDGAKKLFYKFLDSLNQQPNMQFALRIYGHTVKYPPGDCNDSKLVVPFGTNNIQLIKDKVAEASPTGITPIEHSITQSANDFPDSKAINTIILITDGIEECGGDPCKARAKLIEKGIILKPFIIGIDLTVEQIKTFECLGEFFDFDDSYMFSKITTTISRQKPSKASCQINLLDIKKNPTETNVNITFYHNETGNYAYNFIHTLNKLNKPDTLYLDDYPTYNIVAHTIPPTYSNKVKLIHGKHTTIVIDCPQGFLEVKRPDGIYNFNQKIKILVKKSNGDKQTLNVQQMSTTEKYIVGSYDAEILTLPRIYINNISVTQSQTKTIDIPNAGMLTVKALDHGDGCIVKDDKRLEWVCNLNTSTSQIYYLQPGKYRIEWRAKSLKSSIYTIEKRFTINPDVETKVELYK